jgi:HD-GYP domain-containing protein (c-di-GMP phosphodiesterase class II)
VRAHPFHTQQILERVPIFRDLAEDASNHHERLDGRGYFRGLTGDRLTRCARILAVADVIDALNSDRPYRPALPLDRVMALIAADRGTALCPDAMDAAMIALAAVESRLLDRSSSARNAVA